MQLLQMKLECHKIVTNMKIRNFLIFIVALTIFTSSNAQKNDSFFKDSLDIKNYLKSSKWNLYQQSSFRTLTILKDDYIDLDNYYNYINKPSFQISNDVSLLNDVYVNTNGEYTYSKSILVRENFNRDIKINSLNPLGFTNDGASFIFGALDLVLQKL